ncbi:hypothetical protein P4S95_22340 [Aneurinibacillus aneurinilyticus]|nr:hypothetical protein [Aneurinibacillus aneurinilyticus]
MNTAAQFAKYRYRTPSAWRSPEQETNLSLVRNLLWWLFIMDNAE